MITFWIVSLAYLGAGILLNFFGPLSGLIWTQKMNMALRKDVPTWKRVGFMLVLRCGVVLLYPIFLLKK